MKCSFSRPRRTVLTRLAASSIARCWVADCRAMSRFSQSWPSVCPFFSQRRSSSFLRVGSPSALKTSSACIGPTRFVKQKYAGKYLHVKGRSLALDPPPCKGEDDGREGESFRSASVETDSADA